MDLLSEAKKIKKFGIIGLIAAFTVIGAIVTLILNIISGIKILTTSWNNEEVENSKILWGILCFIILGPISAIIFGSIASKKLSGSNN